jgi:hypothetical protein
MSMEIPHWQAIARALEFEALNNSMTSTQALLLQSLAEQITAAIQPMPNPTECDRSASS